jgi:predicted alpha/beta hydrolase
MSASEKLKALDVPIASSYREDEDMMLRRALPQIVAVVEAAENYNATLKLALADLDEKLS